MTTPGAAAQGTTEPAAGSTTTTPAAPAAGAAAAAAPAAGAAPASSTSSAAPAAATQPAADPNKAGASAGDPKAGDAGKTGAAATAAASDPSKKDASTDKPPVVPDKYELKLPEKSPLAVAHVERVSALAKEQGLTNDEAQAVLEHDNEVATSVLEAQQTQLKAVQDGWLDTCKKDPEIGGEGLGQNAEFAKRVIEKHGTAELRKFLDDSKLGNHPEYIRLTSKIYREYMAEDRMVIPKPLPPREAFNDDQAKADKLYGKKQGSAQA